MREESHRFKLAHSVEGPAQREGGGEGGQHRGDKVAGERVTAFGLPSISSTPQSGRPGPHALTCLLAEMPPLTP